MLTLLTSACSPALLNITVPRTGYARKPLTPAERVSNHKPQFMPLYDPKLQAFLDFVLAQYVRQGVGALDQEKLSGLLELRYHTVNDAADQLGGVAYQGSTHHGILFSPITDAELARRGRLGLLDR